MRRRDFIGLLAGALALWPLNAPAQQPVVGVLHPGPADGFSQLVAAFLQGMKEAGYTDGQNVVIEYRWSDGKYDRLPALAADLVRRGVSVIATPGSTPATLAAKAATQSIPVVFAVGSDPIELGFVASLGKPGGNMTGVAMLAAEMTTKRLELLCELVPHAAAIAVLRNPVSPTAGFETVSLTSAATKLNRQIVFLDARNESEIDAAFSAMKADALLVLPDIFFISRRAQITEQALRKSIPSMHQRREYLLSGGLASYGDNYADTWRQVGIYVGRVLSGSKPAELPVLQPTKFDFVINLKTAKALGLSVPQSLLARADEVIE